MDKSFGLHDLISSIESSTMEGIADLLPIDGSIGGGRGESIFSQLLNRIVQGYALKLEDGTEESSASLEILLDGVSDSVLVMTSDGVILRANQAFFACFGYERSELAGHSIFELLPESYRPAFRERIATFNTDGTHLRASTPDDIIAFRGQRHDGTVVSMDCLLSSVQYNGEAAVFALIRDLSFDHAILQQLQETKEHYAALTESIIEAIFRFDDQFNIIFANSGVKNTFGWEREEVLGKHFSMLFPPEVFAKHKSEFTKYFYVDDQDRAGQGLRCTLEFLGATKHRSVSPMEMSFGNSKEHKGRTLTCVIRDITQRKNLERKLRHLAYHDKLTGLGNRDLFNEDMGSLLQNIGANPAWRGSVFFLDLDGFKRINDTLGHDAGDALLVETARRLRFSLRENDAAYRFGGDEFVVILSEIKDVADSIIVAERILASVSNPYMLRSKGSKSGSRVNVGVSIGVAIIPDHGTTIEDATKCADIAMYCSKEDGKNRYTLFDPRVAAKSMERWNLEQGMKFSLDNGGFRLVYQPIMDAEGKVRGMEALLRLSLQDGTSVPPSTFIPLAEENGMIVPLGDLALRRACYDLRRIHEKGHTEIYVSVNVSSRQFDQPNYVDNLEKIVLGSGLSPERLKLEITETVIMRDSKNTIERMREIKRRLPGISFMIDDFGTGYSSLAYLSQLPVDALKIDISFVLNLKEMQNEKVVNAIMNLADSLGLDIVAEGIENEDQRAYFIKRARMHMQGYYFMKPAPLTDVYTLIRDRKKAAAVTAAAVTASVAQAGAVSAAAVQPSARE